MRGRRRMPKRGARKEVSLRRLGEVDRDLFSEGVRCLCGVDEVGRGPLAGPVVAAAVVFPPAADLPGLDDSKRLGHVARQRLVPAIRTLAVGVGLGLASAEEVDRLNILQASLLAMRRAVEDMPLRPDFVLVDGCHKIDIGIPQRALVRGDSISTAVAAASVLAKEHRDGLMRDLARQYPGYGFEMHMGYPTAFHRAALRRLGPTDQHRTTFRGVREFLESPAQGELFADL